MLEEIVGRLNQWAAAQPPETEWRRDPLLDTLPEPLAALPVVEQVDSTAFPRHDGAMLQQAVWLRDTARWARGEKLEPLSRAHVSVRLDRSQYPTRPGQGPVGRIERPAATGAIALGNAASGTRERSGSGLGLC